MDVRIEKARSQFGAKTSYKVLKRILDVILCSIALIVLIPLFLVIGFAVWVEDRGSIFFSQERSGLNGQPFKIYKFRSMCMDAPKMHKELLSQNELDGPAFKIKKDPRITKVGAFLRKTSLDELPQLINIIKGEMSIVGPRPLPTYETVQLSDFERMRLTIKPGLTCYWQCEGRSEIEFEKWMQLDMKYIEEESLWTDIKIIFKTFGAVASGKGAS